MGSDSSFSTSYDGTSPFQPTLPVWGATDERSPVDDAFPISTHAPRMGSDAVLYPASTSLSDFNPRSPYGERPLHGDGGAAPRGFQPTLPVWGATLAGLRPLPVRTISTHAPRMGSDWEQTTSRRSPRHFNPRSPYGERPTCSTRPARAGNFNPRSPYGERRVPSSTSSPPSNFNPRSPYGERRTHGKDRRAARRISTHAPRMGSDPRGDHLLRRPNHFNPRSPYGERRARARGLRHGQVISTHAPRMGSD